MGGSGKSWWEAAQAMYPDGYHVHNYPSGSRCVCVCVCVCVWPRMRAAMMRWHCAY